METLHHVDDDKKRQLKVIGHIRTDFPEKFGIPKQSNLISELKGTIVLEPEYRNNEVFRGLSDYDYLWLIWSFSDNHERPFTATVKPPALGGNERMGLFATRSPYRINDLGLSCLKIDEVLIDEKLGPVVRVSGVDMVDGSPVYDIKPYLPAYDAHENARAGFTERIKVRELKVEFPEELLSLYPPEKRDAVLKVLASDPRPRYQDDSDRKYGVSFAGYDIHFTVEGDILRVYEVVML